VTETDAVVTRQDGGYIWLDICRQRCETCESSGGCELTGGNSVRLQRVRNTIGARVGDTVVVGVASGAVLKAVIYSYLLPLTLALIAAVVGMRLGGEGAAAVGLFLGLFLGWLAMRWAGRRFSVAGEPALAMRIKPLVQQLHRNQ
jgi:sigma-E factor negative regulatory protein RseC